MKSKDDILVGLVDADLLDGGTRHPNLVLLKLAGFFHDNAIPFELITDNNANSQKYSIIYISKVFSSISSTALPIKRVSISVPT